MEGLGGSHGGVTFRLGDNVTREEVKQKGLTKFGSAWSSLIGGLSIGQCLLAAPTGTEWIVNGQQDLRTAERAAVRLESPFTPDQSGAEDQAWREVSVLVDGHLQVDAHGVSRIRLIGGPSYEIVGAQSAYLGHRVWIAGSLRAHLQSGRADFYLSPDVIVRYGKEAILQPVYPELPLADAFTRRVTMPQLVASIEWPDEMSQEEKDYLLAGVRSLHFPQRLVDALWVARDDVQRALKEIVDRYDKTDQHVREIQTLGQAAVASFKEFLASEGYDAEGADPGGAPVLPAPRLVKSARAAEVYAAEIMTALGFNRAAVTAEGADGGVDVVTEEAVAQVKMEGVPTGRPAIQALYGAASYLRKHGVFFSLAGYTREALEWAEGAAVACFEFEFDGTIEPRNGLARALIQRGAGALR